MALGEPICDHLSCELSGSDGKARKLLDKQQPQWKLESVWAIVGIAFLAQNVAWSSFFTAVVKLLQCR